MEPLNLMVSLSHFANDKRENKHGLSDRVGSDRVGSGRRAGKARLPRRVHGWWRSGLRGVTRLATR